MKIKLPRAVLVKQLQNVIGVIARKPSLPILSNVLIVAEGDTLTLTGTDLEAEMVSSTTEVEISTPGRITVTAKKLSDILRSLPDDVHVTLEIKKDRNDAESVQLTQGGRKYAFQTLPASDYPDLDKWESKTNFTTQSSTLLNALNMTSFAMANQDVRYFLNGLLIDITPAALFCVATDGHRMAMSKIDFPNASLEPAKIIIPRASVLEAVKLLGNMGSDDVTVSVGENHIRFAFNNLTMTSKLVDGKFPDYRRVIPKTNPIHVVVDRAEMDGACSRALVLSNEKFKGARFSFASDLLVIHSHNNESESAEEPVSLSVKQGDLSGRDTFDIGFNLNYVLDVLRHAPGDKIVFELLENQSSALAYAEGDSQARFVLMPMRL